MSEDRLSALHPDLIFKIMEAITESSTILESSRMGVLSKHFQQIWCSNPSLIFRMYDFVRFEALYGVSHKTLVNKILNQHVDCAITKLVFDFDRFNEPRWSINSAWVRFGVDHFVQTLKLVGPLVGNLPDAIFSSHTLVKLKMSIPSYLLQWPTETNLPKLQKLVLKRVVLDDDNFGTLLSERFPLLKELQIVNCIFTLRRFTASIQTLKILKLAFNRGDDETFVNLQLPVVEVVILLMRKYMVPPPLLLEGGHPSAMTPPEHVFHSGKVQVSDASTLKLIILPSGNMSSVWSSNENHLRREIVKMTKELLTNHCGHVPIVLSQLLSNMGYDLLQRMTNCYFTNMRALHFTCLNTIEDLAMTLGLINRCSELMSIFICLKPSERVQMLSRSRSNRQLVREYVQKWSLSANGFRTLETIYFKNFMGSDNEMSYVRYVLGETRNLKTMLISYHNDAFLLDAVSITHQAYMIQNYKRASKDAQIYFYQFN